MCALMAITQLLALRIQYEVPQGSTLGPPTISVIYQRSSQCCKFSSLFADDTC